MSEDAGDGITKVQKLRESCGVFIDAMLEGDAVGIVRFDASGNTVAIAVSSQSCSW